MNYVFFLYTD